MSVRHRRASERISVHGDIGTRSASAKRQKRCRAGMPSCPLWVKPGRTQVEHNSSALPPIPDIAANYDRAAHRLAKSNRADRGCPKA
jgi:hypothetical protein